QSDRNERARPQLEEKQFDGEQYGGDGAAEGRGHSRGGAGRKQGLSFGGGGVEDLTEQRSERAAGGDNRTLRAERATGADGDRSRDRLEQGDARGNAALVEQHLLHRLGDAVAADGRRAV